MTKKYTYKECWQIFSKMCAEVHFNSYKPSRARLQREAYAIGSLLAICLEADEEALKIGVK